MIDLLAKWQIFYLVPPVPPMHIFRLPPLLWYESLNNFGILLLYIVPAHSTIFTTLEIITCILVNRP